MVAKLSREATLVRLAVTGPGGTVFSSTVTSTNRAARMVISGLSADTEYTYAVQVNSVAIGGVTGGFKTAPSGNASFTVAFAGDTSEGSNHAVFDTIRVADPLLFIHLGDMHYRNISANTPSLFRDAFDEVFSCARQHQLYREVPTAYVWDDHDSGPNNSDSTTVTAAAKSVYRERVPHYTLGDATVTAPIYQSWVIGRVRFVMTDQRSAASTDAATDNSSKTMLGTTQKTWFKAEISAAAAAGQAVVWVCSRAFGGVGGGDHWGGFTTERTELADYIKANAHGRVVVISADAHALAIDAGTNHDFATGTGEPLRCFQAAPLDRTPDSVIYGGATYSAGWFNNNGQFGTMQVVDSGGSSLAVTWRGFTSAGTLLVTSAFTINL